ncbi:MAG TPA: hypothetical protein VGJ16_05145 [Pirellulales bacterium]|jgi:hypothetical protein
MFRGLPISTLPRLVVRPRRLPDRPLHVLICIADHFEPQRGNASASLARERVGRWLTEYPRLAERYADSRGRMPQHTFFYPAEEYEPEHLDALATLNERELGDVEVHLHHDRDTAESLREKILDFTGQLRHVHGLLELDELGRASYGFIHGNWALDNSRPDGRWCGVNNELSVLLETGCYADFTMPCAPAGAGCQTRTINSIYYATDDPARPKSHDLGAAAKAEVHSPPDSLLMIQGPLALDWRWRKWGLIPRIENGDLTQRRPPTIERLWNWIAAGVGVVGCDHWRFVKLHTHGALEPNTGMLLGEPMRGFHAALARFAAGNDWFHYYYVTAREMAAAVHWLERRPATAAPGEALEAFGGHVWRC